MSFLHVKKKHYQASCNFKDDDDFFPIVYFCLNAYNYVTSTFQTAKLILINDTLLTMFAVPKKIINCETA